MCECVCACVSSLESEVITGKIYIFTLHSYSPVPAAAAAAAAAAAKLRFLLLKMAGLVLKPTAQTGQPLLLHSSRPPEST